MAILSDADRFAAWAEYMQTNTEGFTISKVDIRAALNSVDTWLNDNASALNSAIPQPARGALSQAQKALLLTAVVRKKYLTGVL